VSLDSRVDELYQLPLDEFTAARNALAKSLKGEEAESVKRLQKPTIVPWAVNQLVGPRCGRRRSPRSKGANRTSAAAPTSTGSR
jgi:hypothetical protein